MRSARATEPHLELNPNVVLAAEAHDLRIRCGLWETKVPNSSIADDPNFAELIRHRRISEIGCSPQATGLIRLLKAQGCFLQPRRDVISPEEIIEIFCPFRSRFYAEYYAHPLWAHLRSGTANDAVLTSWVLHNYHISRSAGPIAARLAVTDRAGLGTIFKQDAIEEYWHCDSFYFVDGNRLALGKDDVKRAIPLPGSTAFEDLALITAERDPLGHLLIALFQEASVLFRGDAEHFYNLMELNYALPGFFAGWRRHMLLDEECQHASRIAQAFSSLGPVSCAAFETALRRVHLAKFFLEASLDQICDNSGIARNAIRQVDGFDVDRVSSLARDSLRPRDIQTVLRAIGEAAFRSLAHARSHDEIMAAGKIASVTERIVQNLNPTPDSANPWLLAACNFLIERSQSVQASTVLIEATLQSLNGLTTGLGAAITVCQQQKPILTCSDNRGSRTERWQLLELLHLATKTSDLPDLTVFKEIRE